MKQTDPKIQRAYRFKRFVRRSYAAFNSMHKVVNIGVIAGCILTFAHATSTAAQQGQNALVRDSIPGQEVKLEEVIVTSSKAELTLNQTAKLPTIITQNDIARQPVQSIQDLLKNIVGIDVRQRGPNGVLAGLSMRGSTFDQIAILLNGANLTNPQTGHYSLDLPVNLSDIERIEIIQGPTSLLYGAGAFYGGVNIVTKKDAGTGLSLKTEGGMYQLRTAEARGTFQATSSTHSLSAGYSASGGYLPNSDYVMWNTFWQSRFRMGDAKLDIQWGFNDKAYGANTFYSPAYPNQFDDTQSLFAAVKGEAGTDLKFIPQIYWNRHYDCFQLYRDGTPDIPAWYKGHNYHYSDVAGFNLNTQYKWAGGITNLGGELRNEGIYSNVLGKDTVNHGKYTLKDNRTNISYFLEHTYLHRGLTLAVSVLANYNTAFDDHFKLYPNVNVAWRLTERLKVFASWSNSVRTPTFTDLYYKGATHKGNSDVQPEKSEAFELGARYNHSFLTLALKGYHMKGKNLIDWVKANPEDLWESQNLTDMDKSGFEANVSLNLWELKRRAVRLDLGFMYMNQDKDAGALISNYVMDYLRHKFTAGLSHPLGGGLQADWQFRWVNRAGSYTQYIDLQPAKETAYPAYTVLDVKINRRFQDFNIYLKVHNLFNTTYYDLGNIPQPGFWLMGGATVEI